MTFLSVLFQNYSLLERITEWKNGKRRKVWSNDSCSVLRQCTIRLSSGGLEGATVNLLRISSTLNFVSILYDYRRECVIRYDECQERYAWNLKKACKI